MKTNIEMLEELYKYVKSAGWNLDELRGGFPLWHRVIGVCPTTAYTEDEGWTHGIYVPDLISVFYTSNGYNKDVVFTYGDKETLISLYNLAFVK